MLCYALQLLRTALQNWDLQYHMSRFTNVIQSSFNRNENNWFVMAIVLIALLEMTRRFRISLRHGCSWHRHIVESTNGWIFDTLKMIQMKIQSIWHLGQLHYVIKELFWNNHSWKTYFWLNIMISSLPNASMVLFWID